MSMCLLYSYLTKSFSQHLCRTLEVCRFKYQQGIEIWQDAICLHHGIHGLLFYLNYNIIYKCRKYQKYKTHIFVNFIRATLCYLCYIYTIFELMEIGNASYYVYVYVSMYRQVDRRRYLCIILLYIQEHCSQHIQSKKKLRIL